MPDISWHCTELFSHTLTNHRMIPIWDRLHFSLCLSLFFSVYSSLALLFPIWSQYNTSTIRLSVINNYYYHSPFACRSWTQACLPLSLSPMIEKLQLIIIFSCGIIVSNLSLLILSVRVNIIDFIFRIRCDYSILNFIFTLCLIHTHYIIILFSIITYYFLFQANQDYFFSYW